MTCRAGSRLWAAGCDDQARDMSGDINSLLVLCDVARDVGAFDDQAEFFGERAWIRRAGFDGDRVDNVFDGLLILRRRDVGRFMWEGKLHSRVDKDAPLELIGFDDLLDDIKQCV